MVTLSDLTDIACRDPLTSGTMSLTLVREARSDLSGIAGTLGGDEYHIVPFQCPQRVHNSDINEVRPYRSIVSANASAQFFPGGWVGEKDIDLSYIHRDE
jgi:hypothetical protein